VLPTAESQRVFHPGIFDQQVALVTGGGSGIGLATAKELHSLGAKIAICGRNQAKLDAAREELVPGSTDTDSPNVLTRACDIREPAQVEDLVKAIIARFGRIDILVNNAGGQFPSPAQHISPNGFLAVIKNNLVGTFHVTREVANQSMIPNKSGRIVNVIANIYRGFPGMVHTGAARAGVENMTMTLAVEWAQFGILVNAIAPGIIMSSGTAQCSPSNTGSDLNPAKNQSAYTLVNARLGLGSQNERWMLEAWGQNILNRDYYQLVFDAPLQTGTYDAYLGAPRTYGLTLRVSF